jgi:hypothetical protein
MAALADQQIRVVAPRERSALCGPEACLIANELPFPFHFSEQHGSAEFQGMRFLSVEVSHQLRKIRLAELTGHHARQSSLAAGQNGFRPRNRVQDLFGFFG